MLAETRKMPTKKGKETSLVKTDVITVVPEDNEEMEGPPRSEVVRNHMSAARYIAQKDSGTGYAEFVKYFTDPKGTSALVTSLFRKDAMQEPETLEGFVVTVSMHIKATQEDIEARAWKFIKHELSTLTTVLGGPERKKQHLVTLECPRCKQVKSDFLDVTGSDGKVTQICLNCYERGLAI